MARDIHPVAMASDQAEEKFLNDWTGNNGESGKTDCSADVWRGRMGNTPILVNVSRVLRHPRLLCLRFVGHLHRYELVYVHIHVQGHVVGL